MRKPSKLDRPFLCFVHIEKAGGITLHALLHKLFWAYVSPSPAFGEHFSAKDLKNLKRFFPALRGIGGHRLGVWQNYESVIGKPLFYFTFLRNPVQRYLSHLNWQLHVKKKIEKPEDFISSSYFDDFQTYRIAGERSFFKARQLIQNRFSFVGLLEKYDRSLLLWRAALGQPDLDLRYQRENVKNYGSATIRFEDLPERLQRKVLKKNARDMDLYQWVCEVVYPAQETVYAGNLDEEVEAFRQINAGYRYSLIYPLKRRLSNAFVARVLQPLMSR